MGFWCEALPSDKVKNPREITRLSRRLPYKNLAYFLTEYQNTPHNIPELSG